MSRLTELLARAKNQDAQLAADLEREIKALQERRAFGLNFERHQPEAVELPGRPVRKGDKVRVLPARGSAEKGDQRLWMVKAIDRGIARLELADATEPEASETSVDDLVVVAEFRDFIFPGLVSTGKVERGGDKPFHTVINAENFHALKMLTYTHRGRIDVIYIDPPYNTGARDWKYNNDYVEADDSYRHSKWLAMMERRLLIARELLNPVNSVLIVAIDEKEYLRLGMLLEQTFPDARIQMISTLINPAGGARAGSFGRNDEYLFFVMFGEAAPLRVRLPREWAPEGGRTHTGSIRWDLLRRSGHNNASGLIGLVFSIQSILIPLDLELRRLVNHSREMFTLRPREQDWWPSCQFVKTEAKGTGRPSLQRYESELGKVGFASQARKRKVIRSLR